MDLILAELLKSFETTYPEVLAKEQVESSRKIINPYLLSKDGRGVTIEICRPDLESIIKRISQKLISKLSRRIVCTNQTIRVSCSEYHHEIVIQKIEKLFSSLLTCKCGEKDTRYLRKNFYCDACGFIVPSRIKFNKL